MSKSFNRVIKVIMVLTYVIIFLPIAVIILMSFNNNEYGMMPFEFSFKWYQYLFTKSELLPATILSLKLAVSVCLVTVIIGTISALGMQYLPRKILMFFQPISQLPIIIPWLVQSIALLLLFNFVGIGRSYVSMFFGNLIVVLPYVLMMVAGRFADADRTPEDAARMLGAKPFKVFVDVIFPMLLPGIISGALMSFMVCFNAFCMQYYLAPFGIRTLPIEIYTLVKVGYKPDLNALASILILMSTLIVLALNKLGYSAKKLFG
jgi:ABC-type spermidine/putrescine transport system permease subunit II